MIDPNQQLTRQTLENKLRSFVDTLINKINFSSYYMTNLEFQILLSDFEDEIFKKFIELRYKAIEKIDKETQEVKSKDFYFKCYELLKKYGWGKLSKYHDALQGY